MATLDKIVDIVKNMTELNLRYTSTLLYLGKDYVKDINTVVTTSNRPSRPGGETPPTRSRPLLIAGTRDETVGAAFPLKNSSGRDVNANLVVQGELDNTHIRIEPPSLELKAGESTIVRVIVHIDSKLEVGRDYAGAVAVPGLSAEFFEFVVRRLPDPTATTEEPTEASARSTRRRSTTREGSG